MSQSNLQRVYLKHRIGSVIVIADFTLLFIIFLESGLIGENMMGSALFFWTWSTLLLPVPLIGGLSLKDSLKFFAYSLPLFFLFGLFALIIPTQLLAHFISILAIIWALVLTLLIRRKPEVFDLKPRISPLTFLETMMMGFLSYLCSYLILSFKLIDTVVASLSLFANYFVLTLIFYIAFSIMAIGLHLFIRGEKTLAVEAVAVLG